MARLSVNTVRIGIPVLAIFLGAAPARSQSPSLAWKPDGSDPSVGRFEARGLPEGSLALAQPGRFLTVGVEAGPGLLGTWGSEGNTAWFRPRFPLAPGVRHTVRLGGGLSIELVHSLPVPETPATVVVSSHPSSREIPENILRFYLVFSAPMRTGEAYKRVTLVRDDGHIAELPFLELDEELWDPTGTRLTLLIDPGRIKRGVKPLVDIGPVFESGRRYTLKVDAAWPDANGKPLSKAHQREYQVVPPVRRRIDPGDWVPSPPMSAAQPVEIRFPRPLDKALAERLIRVSDDENRPLAGKAEMLAGETVLRFTPRAPWQPGRYHLAAELALEDPAGNRQDRLFDSPEDEEPGPAKTRRGPSFRVGNR
jgi:hypothetical protein